MSPEERSAWEKKQTWLFRRGLEIGVELREKNPKRSTQEIAEEADSRACEEWNAKAKPSE